MRKLSELIGTPHMQVIIWQEGYNAGLLHVKMEKNPYVRGGKIIPGQTASAWSWEDGRRLASEERAALLQVEPPWTQQARRGAFKRPPPIADPL